MKAGSRMTGESRAKISAGLRGNKCRLGIPHDADTKSRISTGVKRAYAEGRKKPVHLPKNLEAYNAAVRAGLRPHPRKNPVRDAAIVAAYLSTRDAHKAAAKCGISYAAVYYALARTGTPTLHRSRT